MKKILSLLTALTLSLTFLSTSVFASEKNEILPTIQIFDEKNIGYYLDEIADEKFIEVNAELESQGYVLEKVIIRRSNAKGATSDEIRESIHRQPVASKKYYLSQFYQSVSDYNNPLQVALGVFTKYTWIPITLFGISTDMFSTSLASGWTSIDSRDTLHIKAAYIYDATDNRQYWGADASWLHTNATITMVTYDSKNNAHSQSVDEENEFYSSNYLNDAALLRLGRLHYKDFAPYTESYADNNSGEIYIR